MGTFSDMKEAFYERFELFRPDVPRATENTRYDYEEGVTWMRTYHLPSGTWQASLGDTGTDHLYGLFQVDIVSPLKGGDLSAARLADELEAYIPSGKVLTKNTTNVKITKVEIAKSFEDRSWYVTPVTFYYRITRDRLPC